jgi:putative flippase GtrA
VGALGGVLQLGLIWMFAVAFQMHHLLATLAAITLTVAHNFVWHRRWTWNDRVDNQDSVPAALLRFGGLNGVVSLVGNLLIVQALGSDGGVSPVAAGAAGIAACSVVNFWLTDRKVFPLGTCAIGPPSRGETALDSGSRSGPYG